MRKLARVVPATQKSKYNGWPARRQLQGEQDQEARRFGYRNQRDWRHQNRVDRLRALIGMRRHPGPDKVREVMAMQRYYPAHPHLFTLLEVADAIPATKKVITEAERRQLIKSMRLPGQKPRKVFFTLAAIRRFVNSYHFSAGCSRAFRDVKVALDPRVMRGELVPIEHAIIELGITRRGIQYYLDRRQLKKIKCGRRILITRASLARLSRRRLRECERAYRAAKERLEKIRRFR
jgi:hypothetical protein